MGRYSHIAALGSSFAAGPGIRPLENRQAGRSAQNYARLLADQLGARLTDLTVSGATTETILERPQRVGWVRFQPQILGLPPDADLVTVTAGGNDIGYIGSMFAAAWAAWIGNHTPFRGMKSRPIPAVSDEALERAAQGLAGVVEAIRGRAPRAEVVLVDYFTLIGDQTTTGPTSPFGEEAIAALRRTGKQLAQVFLDAADRTGATLVELSEASEGHALGSPEPWVTGFQPMTRGVASFHPNAEGMQAAAQLIWHRLGN